MCNKSGFSLTDARKEIEKKCKTILEYVRKYKYIETVIDERMIELHVLFGSIEVSDNGAHVYTDRFKQREIKERNDLYDEYHRQV
jgi:hypothetical protein